jgi:hypothetical protein
MKICDVSEYSLFGSCAATRILCGIESLFFIAVIIEEMTARPDYSAESWPVFMLLRHHGRLVSLFNVIARVEVIVPMLVEDDLGLLWVL